MGKGGGFIAIVVDAGIIGVCMSVCCGDGVTSVGRLVADAVGIGVMDGIAVGSIVLVGCSTLARTDVVLSTEMITVGRTVDKAFSPAVLIATGSSKMLSSLGEHALRTPIMTNRNAAANRQFQRALFLACLVSGELLRSWCGSAITAENSARGLSGQAY